MVRMSEEEHKVTVGQGMGTGRKAEGEGARGREGQGGDAPLCGDRWVDKAARRERDG